MSDPLRTDGSRAPSAAPEADRDATIEQMLLAGLDQYFVGQYEQAIHVWTRVLFLDRSHARARAYIERARSALAERQRESEELLQRGVAACARGESAEARRLVQAALDSGAPREEAASVLDRLDRLDAAVPAQPSTRAQRARGEVAADVGRPAGVLSGLAVVLVFILAVFSAGVYSAAAWGPLDWRSILSLQGPPPHPAETPAVHDSRLALPRQGELALARARALVAQGHLRDALLALDLVRPTDSQHADAERLRGEIQHQLIALASATSAPARPASPDQRIP